MEQKKVHVVVYEWGGLVDNAEVFREHGEAINVAKNWDSQFGKVDADALRDQCAYVFETEVK